MDAPRKGWAEAQREFLAAAQPRVIDLTALLKRVDDLTAERDRLQARVDELDCDLDDERAAKRDAEELQAAAERQLEALEEATSARMLRIRDLLRETSCGAHPGEPCSWDCAWRLVREEVERVD